MNETLNEAYGAYLSAHAKQKTDIWADRDVTLNEAYGAYLSAHAKQKTDIWADRDVTLEPGKNYTPVAVAVWDGGVDVGIFKHQLKHDESGNPAVIAYDASWTKTTGALLPLTPEQQKGYPAFKALLKGRNDLEANIDTKEAGDYRKMVSEFNPDQARSFQEEIQLFDHAYSHGTHVSGIALAGNPYARLVVARMNPSHTCRSRELTDRKTIGEDSRTVGEARPIPLPDVGGGPSHAAALQCDGASHFRDWVGRGMCCKTRQRRGENGEVPTDSLLGRGLPLWKSGGCRKVFQITYMEAFRTETPIL